MAKRISKSMQSLLELYRISGLDPVIVSDRAKVLLSIYRQMSWICTYSAKDQVCELKELATGEPNAANFVRNHTTRCRFQRLLKTLQKFLLLYKRIVAGSLSWPRTTEEAADLTEEQLDAFYGKGNWRRMPDETGTSVTTCHAV